VKRRRGVVGKGQESAEIVGSEGTSSCGDCHKPNRHARSTTRSETAVLRSELHTGLNAHCEPRSTWSKEVRESPVADERDAGAKNDSRAGGHEAHFLDANDATRRKADAKGRAKHDSELQHSSGTPDKKVDSGEELKYNDEQLARTIFVGNVHIVSAQKATTKKLAAHFQQCVRLCRCLFVQGQSGMCSPM
jgi:hypothetical protein